MSVAFCVCGKQQCLCAEATYLQGGKDIVPIHPHGHMVFPPVCLASFAHRGQLFKQSFNVGFQLNSSFRLENENSDEKEKLVQHNPKVFQAFIL